jgi:class I fructose-bisphosphate aldolase
VGSEHEEEMMVEFRRICDEAHQKKLTVIAWMYPRGKHVAGKETSGEVVAYAARLGLELGADYVKIPYTGDPESFKWVVKNAGKTRVLVQGGIKMEEEAFLAEMKEIMSTGAAGLAIGRNIWKSADPVGLSKKVSDIVFGV